MVKVGLRSEEKHADFSESLQKRMKTIFVECTQDAQKHNQFVTESQLLFPPHR